MFGIMSPFRIRGFVDFWRDVLQNMCFYFEVKSEIFQIWYQKLRCGQENGQASLLQAISQHEKVYTLGLASLLAVPSAAMPPELEAGLDQVYKALSSCLWLTKSSLQVVA